MWVNISAKAKTIVLPHKIEVVILHKFHLAHISTNYCRKHQKFTKFIILHNRIQNSEKFSPIITKNWHFLKCHSNCSTNKCELLICKIIKAAFNCSYVVCEGKYGKVLQTRTFSLQMHYCVHWC